jgi:hypothetical protein
MPRINVERMQTNAAWSLPPVHFQSGMPPDDLDISTWTLGGTAKGVQSSLDLAQADRLSAPGGDLLVALSAADCAALGAGRVDIEVLRLSPAPVRPILRFAIDNHAGVQG